MLQLLKKRCINDIYIEISEIFSSNTVYRTIYEICLANKCRCNLPRSRSSSRRTWFVPQGCPEITSALLFIVDMYVEAWDLQSANLEIACAEGCATCNWEQHIVEGLVLARFSGVPLNCG